jgi:hypothetical protein
MGVLDGPTRWGGLRSLDGTVTVTGGPRGRVGFAVGLVAGLALPILAGNSPVVCLTLEAPDGTLHLPHRNSA